MSQLCQHINALEEVKLTDTHECAECVKTDGSWMHLRVCQNCGVTLCCDDSPAKHMTAHYHETGHPVIASGEAGEKWLWCYKDEQFVEYK